MGGDDQERIRRALRYGPPIVLALLSLWFGLALAFLVASLSKSKGAATPAGRKIFHIAIFSGAVPAQLTLGFWGVVIYGSILSVMVLGIYLKGSGSVIFDAISPPGDGDGLRRTVPAPFLATVFGGLLGTLLAGQFAIVGYLVCGWGDAAGEIVGKRWGRRGLPAPFWAGTGSRRTLEGSLAVFLCGALGTVIATSLLGYPFHQAVGAGLLCGGSGAVAEALSGPATDNFWTQIVPTLVAWWWLT